MDYELIGVKKNSILKDPRLYLVMAIGIIAICIIGCLWIIYGGPGAAEVARLQVRIREQEEIIASADVRIQETIQDMEALVSEVEDLRDKLRREVKKREKAAIKKINSIPDDGLADAANAIVSRHRSRDNLPGSNNVPESGVNATE